MYLKFGGQKRNILQFIVIEIMAFIYINCITSIINESKQNQNIILMWIVHSDRFCHGSLEITHAYTACTYADFDFLYKSSNTKILKQNSKKRQDPIMGQVNIYCYKFLESQSLVGERYTCQTLSLSPLILLLLGMLVMAHPFRNAQAYFLPLWLCAPEHYSDVGNNLACSMFFLLCMLNVGLQCMDSFCDCTCKNVYCKSYVLSV